MFVKAITIKGFKSFADPATLDLEPGISVVVGPNGSGKSNVVDALAWVLGAQAPTAVRSQKMDDVIFAGTTAKKALGRAEVSITIDNTDGELSVEFSEVTITRTLFRSGDSEYAINGVECRLLDIQELLSDSGVGRQQHIIVSQGRIDAVLNARPEDRRSIIEEAAGVLKYRKRKERAERRLSSTGEDLSRLKDLSREVNRQIKPLRRQAEAAQRYDGLVEELNGLKSYLAGQQISRLRAETDKCQESKSQLAGRINEVDSEIADLDNSLQTAETELANLGESDVSDMLSRVSGLIERVKGQINVTTERKARFASELKAAVDEGLVSNLESELTRIDAELALVSAELDAVSPEFSDLEVEEANLHNKQLSFDAEWSDGPIVAPTRVAEVRAQVDALSVASQRSDDRLKQISTQIDHTVERNEAARVAREEASQALSLLDNQLPSISEELDAEVSRLETLESEATKLTELRRVADSEVSHWNARQDALASALESARAEAGAQVLEGAPGVVGVLLELIKIDDGWEKAIEAALGGALRSIVVEDSTNGATALGLLADADIAGSVATLGASPFWPANQPTSPIRSHIKTSNSDLAALLDVLLAEVEVIEGSWKQGYDKAVISPNKVFVTTDGDRFAPGEWKLSSGGSGASAAALAEAKEKLTECETIAADCVAELDQASEQVVASRTKIDLLRSNLAKCNQDKQSETARVEFSNSEASECERLIQDLDAQRAELFSDKQRDAEELKQLLSELPKLELAESEIEAQMEKFESSRTEIESNLRTVAVRRSELQVKRESLKEKQNSLQQRKEQVASRLEGLGEQRESAIEKREQLESALVEADNLLVRLGACDQTVAQWLQSLRSKQAAQSNSARALTDSLAGLRTRRTELDREMIGCRDKINAAEITEAECKVKLEAIEEALHRELGLSVDKVVDTPEPELPDATTAGEQVTELEKELKLMGAINPLAVAEYEELTERSDFLTEQIDDVNKARTELRSLIRSIDEEIVSVFSAAYADVAENFKALFNTLFPGGHGAIKLVNADDLLNCGLEIEAKPSGKSVKKLSLLSGGERSLVALAFLFAVFRSRPSPFYVMDEVEAALDDMNLSRFLDLIEEFRKEAQLIIVSHQKRTMEIADVLYGVSMKPGGSSKVVSERQITEEMAS